MAPPPKLTVSQWADQFRHLSPEASAEPGKWDTGRAEYQRGMMDAISDPRVETVVIMSSAQVGKTELINNLVGYHIHQDPAPMLIINPTTEMGETWSKDRLTPMLRDSPALRGRVSGAKSRSSENTVRQKKFPGGSLAIVGANSPSGLASRPIRVLCCDEVDRYPASAGSEGDPVSLGRKRTATFWNRKVVLVSTPTIAGVSRIESAFEESDKRRFWVPCPHCGETQVLKWAQVRWPEGSPLDALYHCVECGSGWSDPQRWAAVRRGEWRAEGPFRGVAGFHLNELYSPWRRLSETVADFLRDKERPETLKTWVNTALGETWQERGDAPDWQRLYDRREEWQPGTVPQGGLFLTAGVDVQRDRIEASVWAWGRDKRSWLVAHLILPGNPFEAAVWTSLRDVLNQTWRHETGRDLGLSMTAIDSGDGMTTAEVYAFVRSAGSSRVIAVKGTDALKQAVGIAGRTEVRKNGTKLGGLKVWPVGSSYLKGETYGWLKLDRPTMESGDPFPPGYVHLPEHTAGEEYCKQITAEQLVTRAGKNGFRKLEWVKTRDRNEALDCRVYARAATAAMGMDGWSSRRWDAMADAMGAAVVPAMPDDVAAAMPVAPAVPAVKFRDSNWIRR
jgi:phage terminase large subunit GpA-like protein